MKGKPMTDHYDHLESTDRHDFGPDTRTDEEREADQEEVEAILIEEGRRAAKEERERAEEIDWSESEIEW
jgi:hypothetical protein